MEYCHCQTIHKSFVQPANTSQELPKSDELDRTGSAHVFGTDQLAVTQAVKFKLLLNKSESL